MSAPDEMPQGAADRVETDGMTRRQARRLLVVLPFVALLGLGLTLAGLWRAFPIADQALRGEVVWGDVVGFEPVDAAPGAPVRPRVTFRPAGASRPVTITDPQAASPSPYAVGQHVPVIFLPEAPEAGRIMAAEADWTPVVVLLLIGPVTLVLALRGMGRAGRRLAAP